MTPRLVCTLLGVIWAAVGIGQAKQIVWFSNSATNRTSAGASMSRGFSFELGVFKDGFVPSAANTAQWVAKWVPAQRVAYNESLDRFDGSFTVLDNIPPFTAGAAAYVWGFQGGVASSEWILFRKSDWSWPVSSPMDPIQLYWNTASATAVLGSINVSGSPYLMQSAAVADAASPATTWLQWQADELAGEVLNGPDDDPDQDGWSNLLEFVFGTPPMAAGAPPLMTTQIVTVGAQRFLQITIPRRSDHPATLSVQVSSDLTNWDEGPAFTGEVSNSPAAWVVRDLTPMDAAHPKRFMRLKAVLATTSPGDPPS